ncbi:hypothetical protein RRG08_018376 [Elysia crispata]|uniref:Uncharacterized protein n=1 Tax=Elysia crispata TaxID=231223 RepID=A0AAE0YLX8_9GAST|nr:hypothetical protein RRG08_018376 [Elysia crispata]
MDDVWDVAGRASHVTRTPLHSALKADDKSSRATTGQWPSEIVGRQGVCDVEQADVSSDTPYLTLECAVDMNVEAPASRRAPQGFQRKGTREGKCMSHQPNNQTYMTLSVPGGEAQPK